MIDDLGDDESSFLLASMATQSGDSPKASPALPASQPSPSSNTPNANCEAVPESTDLIAETALLTESDRTQSTSSQTPLITPIGHETVEIETDIFEEKEHGEKDGRRKLKSVLKKTPLTPVSPTPETGSASASPPAQPVNIKRTRSPAATKRECCTVS